MKRTAAKIIIAIVIVITYFLIWRPVRVATTQQLVKPLCRYILATNNSDIYIGNDSRGVSFQISWGDSGDEVTSIKYSPPTGFFFLVAMISLVFITIELKWYLYLLGFHLGAFLLTLAFVLLGLYSLHFGFLIADLLISYLVPVFSMAYIPWLIYLQHKK